jgi:GNAT superfamily N-acetyltransferase
LAFLRSFYAAPSRRLNAKAIGLLDARKQRWRMITIAFLADHPEAVPTLTQWFRDQWPEYYAARTPADIAQDFHTEANRDGLPVRLLAFADGVLVGTVTLREQALRGFPEYQPGIGGLFVAEQHRGRGVGMALVRAGMQLAEEQGYATVYIATVTARGIVEHLGWKLVRAITHDDEQTVIYQCDLEKRDIPQAST